MIGDRIKALRESKGYNMRQMASALNLPYTTYVNYEKGAREPNSEQLILISKYFGVSIDYLIGRTDIPSPDTSEDVCVENKAFFRLKKGLEPYNISESDADFLLSVFKAHKESNK